MTRQAGSHASPTVPARHTCATAGLVIAPAARRGRVSGQAGAAHAQRRPQCPSISQGSKVLRSVGRVHDIEVGLAEAAPTGCVRTRSFDPGLPRLSGRLSNPHTLRVPCNPLNYRAFNIRTKMAVVRLFRRKGAERDEKRPEVGLSRGPHGSDNLPGMAAVCGFPTADQERKKNVPTGRLGGARVIRTLGTTDTGTCYTWIPRQLRGHLLPLNAAWL